jgi:hypothetical protein
VPRFDPRHLAFDERVRRKPGSTAYASFSLFAAPVQIYNMGRRKIPCILLLIISFILGGLVLAVLKIINASAAEQLTTLPPPASSVAPPVKVEFGGPSSTVEPMEREFLEEALRALEKVSPQ